MGTRVYIEVPEVREATGRGRSPSFRNSQSKVEVIIFTSTLALRLVQVYPPPWVPDSSCSSKLTLSTLVTRSDAAYYSLYMDSTHRWPSVSTYGNTLLDRPPDYHMGSDQHGDGLLVGTNSTLLGWPPDYIMENIRDSFSYPDHNMGSDYEGVGSPATSLRHVEQILPPKGDATPGSLSSHFGNQPHDRTRQGSYGFPFTMRLGRPPDVYEYSGYGMGSPTGAYVHGNDMHVASTSSHLVPTSSRFTSRHECQWPSTYRTDRCPGKLNFVNRIRQAVKQKLFIFLKYHLIQFSRRIACEKITEWYVQKDKQAVFIFPERSVLVTREFHVAPHTCMHASPEANITTCACVEETHRISWCARCPHCEIL